MDALIRVDSRANVCSRSAAGNGLAQAEVIVSRKLVGSLYTVKCMYGTQCMPMYVWHTECTEGSRLLAAQTAGRRGLAGISQQAGKLATLA